MITVDIKSVLSAFKVVLINQSISINDKRRKIVELRKIFLKGFVVRWRDGVSSVISVNSSSVLKSIGGLSLCEFSELPITIRARAVEEGSLGGSAPSTFRRRAGAPSVYIDLYNNLTNFIPKRHI